MARNHGRRLSAEEKLRVVEEGRQSAATISEVCRRHQVDHAQFYRWERLARQGALEALRNGAKKSKNGKHEERLVSEVNRMHGVVAELTAENLALKKRTPFVNRLLWGLGVLGGVQWKLALLRGV